MDKSIVSPFFLTHGVYCATCSCPKGSVLELVKRAIGQPSTQVHLEMEMLKVLICLQVYW